MLKIKHLIVLILAALIKLGETPASAKTWQPSSGHTQIPLWKDVPDSVPSTGPEDLLTKVTENLIAGKPWLKVENVIHPTITLYSPKVHHTGAAILIFPGGGYRGLAIDLEGTEVCDWLITKGIACVLLKYRVPGSGDYWDPNCNCRVYPKVFTALQDAQRAMGIVRHRASEWKINPHKIGVLGFSAGGHLVAATSTNSKRTYSTFVDDADKVSCRPDFAISLYPGHLWDEPQFQLKSNTHVTVTSDVPPTFLLHAEDDPVDSINHSLVYYMELKKAKVPVEMHLYAQGGHAFGLRQTNFTITQWPLLVEKWLRTIGIISQ